MQLLKKLLTGLIVLALLAGVAGFLLPQRVSLERSVHVEAPPANVFALLNGFRNFDKWSPWAGLDPAMKVGFAGPVAGVGAAYHWAGNAAVGSGSQEIITSKPDSEIDVRLRFGQSPRPSNARFGIEPEGTGCRVTWSFDADLGGNPYARLMAPLMRHFVGQDYERGLSRLKTYAEGLPKTDLKGLDARLETVPSLPIAYLKGWSTTDPGDIQRAFSDTAAKVRAAMQKASLQPAGPPLAITHRWDEASKVYEFDAGIPVDAGVTSVNDGPQLGKTYAGLAIHVLHKGSYEGLKHAYEQINVYKQLYGLQDNGDVWEQYPNDPASTPPEDLITIIEVPVK